MPEGSYKDVEAAMFNGERANASKSSIKEEMLRNSAQHESRLDVQYGRFYVEPDTINGRWQDNLIDGLQAFASVEKPRGIRKYDVYPSLAKIHGWATNPKKYAVLEHAAPDIYAFHNLDNPYQQGDLLNQARMYFDKMDIQNNPFVAISAIALAARIRADALRDAALREARPDTDYAGDPISPRKRLSELPENFKLLSIPNLFLIAKNTPDVVDSRDTDNGIFMGQVDSFKFYMEHEPFALADALQTFGYSSLILTANRFAELTGGHKVPLESRHDKLPYIHPSEFTKYVFPERKRHEYYHTGENELVTMACAAAMPYPILMPYMKDIFYPSHEKSPYFFFQKHALAYQRYFDYDVSTIYDTVPFHSDFDDNLGTYRAIPHEYGLKNMNASAETMAIDLLFVKRGAKNLSYLGLANSRPEEEFINDKALRVAASALLHDMVIANELNKTPAGRMPRSTPYPSVAVEETITEFKRHDPASLQWMNFDNLRPGAKDAYLFVTQPGIQAFVDARIHDNAQKTQEAYSCIYKMLPSLLYEVQKSLIAMPDEYKNKVIHYGYEYTGNYEFHKLNSGATPKELDR